MAGLQRSTTSFRRQGSSGLVWDDRFLTEELNKVAQKEPDNQDQQDRRDQGSSESDQKPADQMTTTKPPRPINTVERSRSNGGGRGYRTGRVSPAIEPPSPKVSACGFCSAFGKSAGKNRRAKTAVSVAVTGKRRSRPS